MAHQKGVIVVPGSPGMVLVWFAVESLAGRQCGVFSARNNNVNSALENYYDHGSTHNSQDQISLSMTARVLHSGL